MAVALSMVLLREIAELPLPRIVDELRSRSEIGHEGLVMSLRYEAAHRPWWKIW
jgi:hypothetical protein